MWSLRRIVQTAFLLLTLAAVFVFRGNAEAWCPLGGVEGFYAYFTGGNMPCSLGVTNLYILAGILGVTLLVKRAFCSHACPIGTVSEWLFRLRGRLGWPELRVTGRADRVFALAKYAVLAVILFYTIRTAELVFRGYDPCYALLSRHGEDITFWAYVVSGGIVLASLFMMVPFCRWLCPFAVVMQPFSRLSLFRIRRLESSCASCGRCEVACPMAIPLEDREEIADARCTACLECVDSCPLHKQQPLRWSLPGGRIVPLPGWIVSAVLVVGIAASVGAAQLFPAPSFTYERDVIAPAVPAVVEFEVEELTCRGRANLLVFYLDRDDVFAVPGYLKLEAWPAPGRGRARISYDPAQADADLVRSSIIEPYFNLAENAWRASPFVIVGEGP